VQLGQFPLWVLPKVCIRDDTLPQVWNHIVWSSNALAEGVHPHRDPSGVSYSSMPNRSVEQERRFLLAGHPI